MSDSAAAAAAEPRRPSLDEQYAAGEAPDAQRQLSRGAVLASGGAFAGRGACGRLGPRGRGVYGAGLSAAAAVGACAGRAAGGRVRAQRRACAQVSQRPAGRRAHARIPRADRCGARPRRRVVCLLHRRRRLHLPIALPTLPKRHAVSLRDGVHDRCCKHCAVGACAVRVLLHVWAAALPRLAHPAAARARRGAERRRRLWRAFAGANRHAAHRRVRRRNARRGGQQLRNLPLRLRPRRRAAVPAVQPPLPQRVRRRMAAAEPHLPLLQAPCRRGLRRPAPQNPSQRVPSLCCTSCCVCYTCCAGSWCRRNVRVSASRTPQLIPPPPPQLPHF